MTIRKVSVKELREDYRQHSKSDQDRNEWLGYHVFRPLSFYPTALFMKLGFTANQTTWLSLAVLALGCLSLSVGEYMTTVAGALMLNIWLVLDFVDGNIARYVRTCSRYGEFIDALGAFLAHWSFFAAGIGFYFSQNSRMLEGMDIVPERYATLILITGAIASLSAVWIRLIYHKFRTSFPASDFKKHDVLRVRDRSSVSARLMYLGHNLVNLSGLLLPAFLIAAALRLLDVFLILVAIANVLILGITLYRLLRIARTQDGMKNA